MPAPLPRRTALSGLVAGSLVGVALTGGCSRASHRGAHGDDAVPSARRDSPTPDGLPAPLAQTLRDGEPRRAGSPDALVAQIVAAERAIATPSTSARVLAAAGHLQQVAYRVLGRRSEWDGRVRALLPRGLRDVAGANVASRREFIALQGGYVATSLPAWRIVRPEPASRLLAHYREAERRFGVDWEYLAAINLVETGMGRIRGFSVAGARGPMQFIPATWDAYGRGDIDDPHDAIQAAGRYLAARGFADPGGRPGALYSYNNSDHYVRGVTELAQVMQHRPRAFLGYYHWEIYYRTADGDVLLPVGYDGRRRG